uniref:leucine--tRNA ligase n=1 Tax=Timema genevievae TaxID=629358 RepID=A0A7R9PPV8_TIMGE|nr:unnamed protein product [Timema genevievae]
MDTSITLQPALTCITKHVAYMVSPGCTTHHTRLNLATNTSPMKKGHGHRINGREEWLILESPQPPSPSSGTFYNEDFTLATKHSIENYWKSKLKFPPDDDQKPKYYVLSMFPYPSGRLHMGHVRVYTISDTMARFNRMNGKNVIHPMGWDAFGLPAENAAIERSVEPRKWTNQNIDHMKKQMKQLGCSFDWDREVSTCDPSYYHWTQTLFLKLYDSGLVYRKEALVNWDPVDQTVLADEQVDENGCSWRSGAKIEKKLLNQWFIRATQFAKSLYDGLSDPLLKNWRDIIKVQKHWIGECDGTTFEFELEGIKSETRVNVWTRNPESVLEATFIAVSPGSVLDKLDSEEAMKERVCEIARKKNIGGYPVSSKLRDWLISRQRYWGTPIPMIHCTSCGGVQPVPLKDLPVVLPEIECLASRGQSPLLDATDWLHTKCPKCGGDATRETDTMDTFVDSSWYFLRYLDPHNKEEPFNKERVSKFMPVDLYIGGKEHAVLHLYYARLMNHFLHQVGLVPHREPFRRLLVQGMVKGRSYRVKGTGRYLTEQQVDLSGPFLTLRKKYEIIQEVDEKKITETEIAWRHGIPKLTLFLILKMREEIVNVVQKEGHNRRRPSRLPVDATSQPGPYTEPQLGSSTAPSSAPLTFTRPCDEETWQRLSPDCMYEYIAADNDIKIWCTLDNADIIREQQESSNEEGEEEMEEEPEDIPTVKAVL